MTGRAFFDRFFLMDVAKKKAGPAAGEPALLIKFSIAGKLDFPEHP